MPAQQKKSINVVVAENIGYWMEKRGLVQQDVARRAGVAQKTISNFLRPGQRAAREEARDPSHSGREPSGTLTALDRIAQALRVSVWQLTRDAESDAERDLYDRLERSARELLGRDSTEVRDMPDPLSETVAPAPKKRSIARKAA